MYIPAEQFLNLFEEGTKGNYLPIIEYLHEDPTKIVQDYFYKRTNLVFNALKNCPPEKKAFIAIGFLQHKKHDFISLAEFSAENQKIITDFWDFPEYIEQKHYARLPIPLILTPLLDKEDSQTNAELYSYWNLCSYFSSEQSENQENLKKIYPYIIKKLFKIEHAHLLQSLRDFYSYQQIIVSDIVEKDSLHKFCKEQTINNPRLFKAYSNLFNPYFYDFIKEYMELKHKDKNNIDIFIKCVLPELSNYSKELFLFNSLKISSNKKLFEYILKEGFNLDKIEDLKIENPFYFYAALKEHKNKPLMLGLINSGFIDPLKFHIAENKFSIQGLATSYQHAEQLKIKPSLSQDSLIKKFFNPIGNTGDTFFSTAAKDSEQFFTPVINIDFSQTNITLSNIDKNYQRKAYNVLLDVEKFEFLTDFLEKTWFSKTPPYAQEYNEKNRQELLICEHINRNYSSPSKSIWVLTEYIELATKLNLKNQFLPQYLQMIAYQFGKKIKGLNYIEEPSTYLQQCEYIVSHLQGSPGVNWGLLKEGISSAETEHMRDHVKKIFNPLLVVCLERTMQTRHHENVKFKI